MRQLAFISLLFLSFQGFSQIMEKPLPNKKGKSLTTVPQKNIDAVQNSEGAGLPFWDDFSLAVAVPSADKWVNSDNIRISNGTGISAPTINAALFDGIDANGAPYNASSLLNGPTDSLISMTIDLSMINADQTDSVYLSFFWQVNGIGELPDSEDSLVLQFRRPDGSWQSQWQQTGGRDNERPDFTQELIQVPADYFHSEFQFRFRSFSRLAGAFDTWLVDYIYLNEGRYPGDIAYPDRALTRKPSFLIAPYTAMPTEQFFANPTEYIRETSAEFLNLNDIFQPVQYSAIVIDRAANAIIETLNDGTVASPLPGAFERVTFTSPALDHTLLDRNADSLLLETNYFIQSGDNFFIDNIVGTDTTFIESIDYRVNDTVKITTVIDDYLAYDDGEPDFAAGINQSGGKLAYRYVLEERALLTHIDINFPFVTQAGEPIELMVWRDIKANEREDSVLFQDPFSVLRPSFIGEMRAYQLDTPIFVQDTIYIGFSQATNEFLAVGLDKNNDSGEQMFFNVDGTWRANEFVRGSLLIRPRFDKQIAANFEEPTGGGQARIDIFPNPSAGIVTIPGQIDNLNIFDSYGKQVRFRLEEEYDRVLVDLSLNKKGIYLLRIVRNGQTFTKRIILKD
ncbi:MAG: hypothetical protein Roseis2KO_53890 [Roseivirga sp.]